MWPSQLRRQDRPAHRTGNCSPVTFSRMVTVRVAAGQVPAGGEDAVPVPQTLGSRAPLLRTSTDGSALSLCCAGPFSST